MSNAMITGPDDGDSGEGVSYWTDDDQPRVTITYEDDEGRDDPAYPCEHCGTAVVSRTNAYGTSWRDAANDLDADCPVNEDDEGEPWSHEVDPAAMREPARWLNSATAAISGDEVQVSISVGDPRGGFQMSVRRHPDGYLILHVPHPSEPVLHADLTEIHPGTYRIG